MTWIAEARERPTITERAEPTEVRESIFEAEAPTLKVVAQMPLTHNGGWSQGVDELEEVLSAGAAAVEPPPVIKIVRPTESVEIFQTAGRSSASKAKQATEAVPVKLPPKPAATAGPTAPVSAEPAAIEVEGDYEAVVDQVMASHVPGLTAIRPRCPGQENIELALDESGGLHLLAGDGDLRNMLAVKGWARALGELLSMACPEHEMDVAAEIECHLFTDEPMKVADLLEGDIHLHLLAPVMVEGKQGWYAAPLNRPHR